MPISLFPSLTPKIADPLWFAVDRPCEDESELLQLEQEHQAWVNCMTHEDADLVPIGKTAAENFEDEEEEDDDDEEEEDDNGEDTDDNEIEELEMDITYDRDSPVDVGIRLESGIGSSASHGVR